MTEDNSMLKSVGRPRAFNIDSALLAAINVFWEKGYNGASMKDLTQAMGISAPSLYSTFGDKHRLFLKAIDRYANDEECLPLLAFEAEPDIKKAVIAFMQASINYATQAGSVPQGCFMSSCVAASVETVEGAKEMLKQSIDDTDNRLARRFDAEVSRGKLPNDFPALERARLMFDLRQGMVLRARAGISKQSLSSEIKQRAAMIFVLNK